MTNIRHDGLFEHGGIIIRDGLTVSSQNRESGKNSHSTLRVCRTLAPSLGLRPGLTEFLSAFSFGLQIPGIVQRY